MGKPEQGLDDRSNASGLLQGKLTMAQAADIKGVSYHTVSRAVRRGRLRAERLGRMALIAPEDLEVWRPMRERAPKQYRDRLSVPDLSKWMERVDATNGADLVIDIGESLRRLQVAAVNRPISDVADLIASYVARALDLQRVSVWAKRSAGGVDRVGGFGPEISTVPGTMDESAFSGPEFDFVKVRVLPDAGPILAERGYNVDNRPSGPILAMPLLFNGELRGWLFGDCAGEPMDITPQQLEIADVLAANLAYVLDCSMKRVQQEDLLALFEQTLGNVHEAIEIRTATNHALLTNPAYDAMFNNDWTWTEGVTGQPVASADHAFAEVERTGKPISTSLVGLNSDGSQRLVDVRTGPLALDGRVLGFAQMISDQIVDPDRARALQQEIASQQDIQRRSQAINSAMLEIAEQRSVADVVDCAVRILVERLSALGGVGLLRNDAGLMVVVSKTEALAFGGNARSFDPISIPSLILAIGQRRALILRQADASVGEQMLMEARGAQSTIIVPIQNGEITLGAIALLYPHDVNNENPDLEFASEIGKRCTRIIEHLRTIEESASSGRRVRAVIDQLPQAVIVFGYPGGRVKIVNRAACSMLRRDIEAEQLGTDGVPMIDGHGQRLEHERHPAMRTMFSGQATLGQPITLVRQDRSQVQVLANHSLLVDRSGSTIGVVCVLQDRADFKPLDEAKDEFLSVVAHELRNPLTSLRGNLQLMQRRLRKREQDGFVTDEFGKIGTVIDQADRISELVGRLLDVSRVDLGKLNLSLAETDASALVQSMVDSSLGIAANRDIRVTAPQQLDVIWDQVRVEQVLANLLSNAINYTEEGPIDVELIDVDQSTVQITVRDHGDGVPDSIKARLFKQYFRLERDSNENALDAVHGLGIGLYLSARYAQVHGGELTVEDAQGGGAMFRLTMPRIVQQSTDGEKLLSV